MEYKTLASDIKMPVLGFGVFQVQKMQPSRPSFRDYLRDKVNNYYGHMRDTEQILVLLIENEK